MKSKSENALRMIGLATNAGKTATGTQTGEYAIKSKRAKLVIVSEDASENTKNSIARKCEYNKLPLCEFASKDELGKYTGKSSRTIVVVTDSGFAERIKKLIDQVKCEI